MYKILDEYYSASSALKAFADQYKAANTTFQSAFFSLSFDDEETFFEPDHSRAANADPGNSANFLGSYASSNRIYSDLHSGVSVAKKRIFGEEYIVKDAIRKIRWKITDETRDIIGFTCRRANAIIMDSIYVVAFYTDQIVPQGGPESFSGLPGMILGVALPEQHITWFATGLAPKVPVDDPPVIPTVGKGGRAPVTEKELSAMLHANENLQSGESRIGFILSLILL
jgi:GLPGLI family protein